jgi:hypothetical protein
MVQQLEASVKDLSVQLREEQAKATSASQAAQRHQVRRRAGTTCSRC